MVADGTPAGEAQNWRGFRRSLFWVADRYCWLTEPLAPRDGRPWVWRTRYAEWAEEADRRLLDLGYHVAWMDLPHRPGAPVVLDLMDAFHAYLTRERGLSRAPVLRDVSRGNISLHAWAARHPDRVSCLVGIAPVCDVHSWPGGRGVGPGDRSAWEDWRSGHGLSEAEALEFRSSPIDQLQPLADARIPILHVYHPQDEIVPYEENSAALAQRYRGIGGSILLVEARIPLSAAPPPPADPPGRKPHGVPGVHIAVGRDAAPDEEVAFVLEHTRPAPAECQP